MNMKTTNTTTPRKYEVSEATAAILDSIVAVSDAYDRITDALQLRYGVEKVDEKAQKYHAALSGVIDLLHAEITGQVIDNMGNTANSHSKTPII